MNIANLTVAVDVKVTVDGCKVPKWRTRLLAISATILGVPLDIQAEAGSKRHYGPSAAKRKAEPGPGVMTAILELNQAIDNPGPVPGYHAMTMKAHRREWPTLWRAIDHLIAAAHEQPICWFEHRPGEFCGLTRAWHDPMGHAFVTAQEWERNRG